MSHHSSFLDLVLLIQSGCSTSPSAASQTLLRCLGCGVDLISCRACRLCKPGQHKEGCLVLSPVRLVALPLSNSHGSCLWREHPGSEVWAGLTIQCHLMDNLLQSPQGPKLPTGPRDGYNDFITNLTSRATCKYKTSPEINETDLLGDKTKKNRISGKFNCLVSQA